MLFLSILLNFVKFACLFRICSIVNIRLLSKCSNLTIKSIHAPIFQSGVNSFRYFCSVSDIQCKNVGLFSLSLIQSALFNPLMCLQGYLFGKHFADFHFFQTPKPTLQPALCQEEVESPANGALVTV